MSRSDYRDIKVRGGKYHRMAEALDKGWLQPRTQLILRREPENEYDSRAVAVFLRAQDEEVQIGHVSAEDVGRLYWRLDRGAVIMSCPVLRIDTKKLSLVAHLELQGGWKAVAATATSKCPKGIDDLDDDIPF